MTRQFFNKQFAALVSAFPKNNLTEEAQDTYWSMLQDIPEEKFSAGVKHCLAYCKFFPTIAELGNASMPPVRDYKAPLPPAGKPFATLNWHEQLEQQKHDQVRLARKQSQGRIDGPTDNGENGEEGNNQQ